MLPNKPASYGSLGETMQQFQKKGAAKKSPTSFLLVWCLIVPPLIFVLMHWLRWCELRYTSETFADMMCCILLFLPMTFGVLAFDLSGKVEADSKPMSLLAGVSMLAWSSGLYLGSSNFNTNMRPFYEISRMNVYPSVDPSKYTGNQLMDAGTIIFTQGTRLDFRHAVGFKNGATYCAAPIISGNSTPPTFDFWAVGLNCCSAHVSDFHCGEYASTATPKGLRLLDDNNRNMFHLVVKKAQAQFNLKVSNPVLLHWLSHPDAEISAYQDDGWQSFLSATFGFLSVDICVVVLAAVVFARITL